MKLGFQFLLLNLQRFTWRHARKAPASTAALIAIISLGVAVFYSVRLSNRAAVSGFGQFTQTISGGSDYVVTGAAQRIWVERLHELRAALNPLPITLLPVIEGTASLPGSGRDGDGFDAVQVPVIGIDLLAVRNLEYVRDEPNRLPLTREQADEITLGKTDESYLTQRLATRIGVELGESYEVVLGDSIQRLRVSGIVKIDELQPGRNREMIIMDIPALQSLLNLPRSIDRVEVIIPDGGRYEKLNGQVKQRLETLDKTYWNWSAADSQRSTAETMTAAFRLNLTILSALSLLVGVYLIIQAMETAVVRRRKETGILLSLGYEPHWIRVNWMVDSLVLGIIGSGLGLLLGWAMAQGAVRAVAQTVNALYVSTTANAAAWDNDEALLAFILGVSATFAAGVLPARDAAATRPIQSLRQEEIVSGIRLLDSPLMGAVLILAGLLFAKAPAWTLGPGVHFPLGGYLAAIAWLLAAAILSSNMLRFIPSISGRLMERSAHWKMAVSQCRKPSGRQKLTIAGLVVAVGMAAGMEILTHSFEGTVSGWINQSLKADLFVAVKGIENASSRNRISEATWRRLQEDSEIEKAEIGHFFPIEFNGAQTMIMGMRTSEDWNDQEFIWVQRPAGSLQMDQVLADGQWPVLVSESFSVRFQKKQGDDLTVVVPVGERHLRIIGVYADYGNERGAIMMNGETAAQWFDDFGAVNLAATLVEGADPEIVRGRWLEQFPGLAIRTNRALREEVFTIFHQTFAVTNALKAIGVVVAVCGLALALFSLLMDRRHQLITLRELGFLRSGIIRTVTLEGMFMTAIGLVGGLLLSLALGYLLIHVINKQSFGWTLAYAVPVGGLAGLAAGVLLAAALTSMGIGRWAARLKAEVQE